MISKFLKTFGNLNWIICTQKKLALCDFGDKLYGEIETSIVWEIVRGYWGSCQVLRKIWIDDS